MATQVYLDRKVFPLDWIGTYYEVPVANGYRLVAISTDYGTIIDPAGATVVDHIDSVQVIGDTVIGEVASQYFLFQPNTGAVTQYDTLAQLRQGCNLEPGAFRTVRSLLATSPVDGHPHDPRLPRDCPDLRLFHPLQENLQLSCSFIRDLTKSKEIIRRNLTKSKEIIRRNLTKSKGKSIGSGARFGRFA